MQYVHACYKKSALGPCAASVCGADGPMIDDLPRVTCPDCINILREKKVYA